MKVLRLLLLIVLTSSFVLSDYVIDTFDSANNSTNGDVIFCTPSEIFGAPSTNPPYGNLQQYINNVTNGNVTVSKYPDAYCTSLYNIPEVFGGYRRITVHTQTSGINYPPQTQGTVFVQGGLLTLNLGADLPASLQLVYQGNHAINWGNCSLPHILCSQAESDTGPYVTPGIDITQGGKNQAFALQAHADHPYSTFVITVISSGPVRGSAAIVEGGSKKRTVTTEHPEYTAEQTEEEVGDLIVTSVKISPRQQDAIAERIPHLRGQAATAPTFIVPFRRFGLVDFTDVRSISLVLQSQVGLDGFFLDFRAVPLISATKTGVVVDSIVNDGVGEPGEILNFSIVASVVIQTSTGSGGSLPVNVNNVLFYDNFNAYDNYATFIPSSLTVTGYNYVPTNCTNSTLSGFVCQTSYVRDNFAFNGTFLPGYSANNQLAYYIPSISAGNYVVFNYSMVVNPLACGNPTCPSGTNGCLVPNQQSYSTGPCLCTRNTAYFCTNEVNSTNSVNTIALLQQAFNGTLNANVSAALFQRCFTATDLVTKTIVTSLPVGAIPNPAVTVRANPTDKANGLLPCASTTFTITVTNNRSRASDAFNLYVTPDSNLVCGTGSGSANPTFTTDGSGRIYRAFSSGLAANAAALAIPFTCNVSCSLGCGVNNTVLTANINFGQNTNRCPEDITADDTSSDNVPLIGAPSLTITKSNAATITLGSNSTNLASFTITVSNTGSRTASSVTIVDTVPAALASIYQASDNSAWTSSGNNQYSFNIASLTAGQSTQLTFNYRIPSTASDCVTGSYSNTAAVSGTCGGSATSSATVNFVAIPDMSVSIGTPTISPSSTSPAPGSVVCYPISYRNLGYRAANSIVLNVVVPSGTTYSSAQSASGWTAVTGSSNYTLTVNSVPALATGGPVNFCVLVNANVSCGSAIATSVSVSVNCPGFPEQNFANNAASSSNLPISGSVTLSLSKTASVTSITPGSTVTYTLRGSNSGNSQATGLTFSESVPSGFTAGSNQGWSLNGVTGQYTYSVGTVAAGSSFGPVTFSVVAPSSVTCPSPVVVNTATVSETCTGATANASLTLPISASPVLGLTAPNTSTVVLANGNSVCVTACYTNTGNQNAANSTMTLQVPQYTTFVASSGYTLSGSTLSYNVGNIAVGANVCANQACFTVQSPIPCGINNVAFNFTLSSPCAPSQTRTANSVVNIVANPIYTITKTNNLNGTDARPGQTIQYTIQYANIGYRIPTDVVLAENLPTYLTSGFNPSWTCSGSTCTIAVGTLSPSAGVQTVNFNAVVSQNIAGRVNINNTATVTSTNLCPATAPASSIISVAGFPNLRITKTDGGITVSPGEYIYYTIQYSNVGDSSADQVIINETVPSFTTFDATLSTPGWSCTDGAGAGTMCVFRVGTLNQGASGQLRFVVQVDDWVRCGVNTLTNVATIQTLNPAIRETDYSDNSAVVTTPLEGKPDLVITKETNRTQGARYDRAGAGDLIVYNITFANVGVRDGLDTTIFETIPEYTVFDAVNSSPEWNCSANNAGSICTFYVGEYYPTMMNMDSTMIIQFAVRVVNDLPPWAHVTNNCVFINNTCDDCNPFNNMACYPVTLYGVPDLTINQTAYCQAIHWYVEWSNQGDQAASNVVITDTIPAESTFDSSSSDSRWSCNTQAGTLNFGQCTINVGSLNSGAGGSAVFVTHPIAGSSLTTFTNRASASGTGNNPDPTPDNNSDSATVGYEGCPDSCDSCCPTVDECCPDKTEVVFQFGGLLNGIDKCNSS